jgi:hypothetical protein
MVGSPPFIVVIHIVGRTDKWHGSGIDNWHAGLAGRYASSCPEAAG